MNTVGPQAPGALKLDIERHFSTSLGRAEHERNHWYLYLAAAMAVRDRVADAWRATKERREAEAPKRVFYLSMEFLLGRALTNALKNLEIDGDIADAVEELGVTLEELQQLEADAGLGNGGLGRLAACFLDSCASLDLPVTGYGLRYEYGMFFQSIENGFQIEEPDHWLLRGYPWEFPRHERRRRIHFEGRSEAYHDEQGALRYRWIDTHDVSAVPFDLPIPGYQNAVVNTLRLWKSEATDRFDLGEFNEGSYAESVAQKNAAENITMVLYPNDASENGKVLRLQQQYFLASASLQDVLADWCERNDGFAGFADAHCFQLNDTHPAITVAELMRLLLDEHRLDWGEAWDIVSRTVAYTNHTLLPEALETWRVDLFARLLPRPYDIICEINARFMSQVAARWPGDHGMQQRLSIITEGPDAVVRMAHLAVVGSFSVNGVAALHSELLTAGLFRDFHALWPDKFNNKTNGVTPRRWLSHCNPRAAGLITSAIGDGWVGDFSEIGKLKPHADDAAFGDAWMQAKRRNKAELAAWVRECAGVGFDPDAMVDVQVKRIHEYKRQLLNVLHVIHLYRRFHDGETTDPRFVLIGGKAAPGYVMAKLIVKLINNVANCVNADTASPLGMVFLPNYSVSAMERICPAADLSEQISTAGKEASGTGNMKLMMNGALTIGTADGANIEILERVGEDNFFLFGMSAAEVESRRANYDPNAIIAADPELEAVMMLLESGHFSLFEAGIFDPIIRAVRDPHDPWMTAADFRSYVDAQERASGAFADRGSWSTMSILNTAGSGDFSSDRTIAEYNRDIWRI
ncbi:MAG: glycogen/starch/alpha-glucan phosphorylase [Pseudomonadota bacterium]